MSWRSIVAQLERLRTPKGRRTEGAFFVEGYRLLERALESGVVPHALLVLDTLTTAPPPRAEKLLRALAEAGCPCHAAPVAAIEAFTDGRTFGPMLGILPTLPRLDLNIAMQSQETTCRYLVLVNVMDPGNIGALSRTAMASGFDGMLAAGGTDIFHPKAMRTSMGALFDLPVAQVPTWKELLKTLQELGCQNIGAVVKDGTSPTQGELKQRVAVWMGSEAHGLPAALEPQLDLRWTIPMPSNIDSFSVNAATAVLLYEVNRRQDRI